jgi:Asp-tRNA(Asn)/Glu-tRNA(Gln) amidotransferase B subunit
LNEVLNENKQAKEDLENKQMKVMWFVMWQVMKKTWWKANPAKVQELLKKKFIDNWFINGKNGWNQKL